VKSKRHFFNLTSFIAHKFALVTVLYLFSISIFAEENDYQFNKIVQLNHSQLTSSHWRQLVPDTSSSQQYFIINNTGQMHTVDEMGKTHTVLDLNIDQQKESPSIKLTAIELHPNFSLRDQVGYGTFYTAHLEALDENSRTKRIQERSSEIELKFDAVITQWQFSSGTHKKVDLETKREVVRIAVPDKTMNIKQLSFSPYKKSWNDDFGLLYIALNGEEKWKKPLYSGVVLRINPAKFGMRSFTIPNSNPYLKDDEIKGEIYLLGAQNIKQFIWPDKNGDDILVSHQYENKRLLSLTRGQDDWRVSKPKKVIYQSDNIINDILSYRGRDLPYLRNRLLVLKQDNQQWLVESLNIKPSLNQGERADNKPQQEWKFTSLQLTDDSEISFSTNRNGEILVLNKTAGTIFQISQENADITMPLNNGDTSTESQRDSTNSYFIYFILLIVIGVAFYWLKRNRYSAKSVVRKQFAHIELSESQLQIGLYHRHQSSTDTIIDIADVVSCEAKLNEQSINIINQEIEHGFNHDKEQDLRNIFAKEQVDKMVDGKVRQISLLITDNHEKNYTICLYMRKGSDRITKKTYSVVINDLIDWCWLIAEKINSNNTDKRKKKPVISVASNSIEKSQEQVPLHNQAAAIRSVTHDVVTAQEQEQPKKKATAVNVIEEVKSTSQVASNNTIDTELVNALEKLVDLKQQGFLTQEEFIKAKENLMQSLFDRER